MPVCAGIKRDGGRCTVVVSGPDDYCYQHAPERAAERRRNASRAGKSKPSKELRDAKHEIRAVIGGVLTGKVERAVGAVALQGYNTLLKALETERRIRETEGLEERLERLEQSMAKPGGNRRWR